MNPNKFPVAVEGDAITPERLMSLVLKNKWKIWSRNSEAVVQIDGGDFYPHQDIVLVPQDGQLVVKQVRICTA